jgi:pimeloyl-ACP methyl ester carboxylesterase
MMATFVLVHGAWHGAWCWEPVAAELARQGHRATAIDLPSHGADPTDASGVTLDAYAGAIVRAVRAEDGPVVLVGHSMGGMAISAAAELAPERIARLIYVAAFLPRDGESLLTIEERNPRLSVPLALIVEASSGTAVLAADKVRDLFYHDLPIEAAEAARGQLTRQALAPLGTPVRLTGGRFGSVPKSYLVCSEDRAIAVELQRDMIARSAVERVETLAASHSPFLSMALETAAALVRLA